MYQLPENKELVARKTEAAKGRKFATAGARYNAMTEAARELYDHRSDPQENANVADLPANRGLVSELTRQMQAGWQTAEARRPGDATGSHRDHRGGTGAGDARH